MWSSPSPPKACTDTGRPQANMPTITSNITGNSLQSARMRWISNPIVSAQRNVSSIILRWGPNQMQLSTGLLPKITLPHISDQAIPTQSYSTITYQILARIPTPACLVDCDGLVLHGNPIFCSLLQTCAGKAFIDVAAIVDQSRILMAIASLKSIGTPQTVHGCATLVHRGENPEMSSFDWTMTKDDLIGNGVIMICGMYVPLSFAPRVLCILTSF